MAELLPERQWKVLNVIHRFTMKQGYPPTVREIGDAIEVKSTSLISYYLKRLEDQELILRETSMSRAIRLTPKAMQLLHTIPVTINDNNIISVPMLGVIAAGAPIPVEALSGTDTVELNRALFGKDITHLFALQVEGNSMIDALINDGDMIILQYRQEVENGEMAAVWLKEEGETTLKKVYREGSMVRLQPANSTMDPIYVPADNVEIQGKVVLVIRQLN